MRRRIGLCLAAFFAASVLCYAAGEGRIRHQRTVTKNGVTLTWDETDTFDVSGSPVSAGVQTVGTTAETIDAGDVSSVGRVAVKNLDGTNFVDYGPDNAGTMVGFGRIGPGEVAEMRLKPGVTMKLQADTAACQVRYELFSE